MRQLTGLEAVFLHAETPRQAMHLTTVGCYDPSGNPFGPVDLAYVLDYARERAAGAELLRRKLTHLPLDADHPYWTEDPDFAVENHVFHSVLPAPGSRDQLDAEVARIHALPIDREHPLWEWWFIEGMAEGGFAVAFKLHQAAFDAAASAQMMSLAHDEDARGPPPSSLMSMDDAAPRPPPPGLTSLIELSYAKALTAPIRFFETALETAQAMIETARHEPSRAARLAGAAPPTPFNRALGGGRAHGLARLGRPLIESAAAAVPGAAVEHVALCVIGGAVRRYLLQHGALPPTSLVAGVPGAADGGLILTPVGSDIADPVQRLRHVQAWLAEGAVGSAVVPAESLSRSIDFLPGLAMRAATLAFTQLRMADAAPPACNLFVLNAAAPRGPRFFAQSRMTDQATFGPIWDGAGLLHVIGGFEGEAHVAFVADAKLVPDPGFYRDCLAAAATDLAAALA